MDRPTPSEPDRVRRTGAAWLLAAGVLVYAVLQVWLPARHLADSPGDFGNYYQAARAILAGSSPYTVHNFDYPPLVSLVVLPLGLLSLEGARIAWFVLSEIALLAAAALTWRALGGGARAAAIVAVLWCFAGTIQANLAVGQVHPLMLALLAGAFAALDRRPRLAGVLLGLAAALKLWPALLLGVFLLQRRWGAFASGVATAAAGVLVPLALLAAALPPPALPASAGYWRGNPAPLNLSLPATALRLATWPAAPPDGVHRGNGTDGTNGVRLGAGAHPGEEEGPRQGAEAGARQGDRQGAGPARPMPRAWLRGNNPRVFKLPSGLAQLSVLVSLLCLAAGGTALAGIGMTGRRLHAGGPASGRTMLAALVSLALVASPISWYHYQLFQLPGLALVGAGLWRHRGDRGQPDRGAAAMNEWARWARWSGWASWVGLVLALTWSQRALGAYVAAFGWTVARPALLFGITTAPALAGCVLFAWLAFGWSGRPVRIDLDERSGRAE